MDKARTEGAPVVFTIGHSNHSPEAFVALLKQHRIEVLTDVRSSPYSRYAFQFNKGRIERILAVEKIRYVFLGDAVGGRPDDEVFVNDEGFVLYDQMAQSPAFREGIARIQRGAGRFRMALLCGEEDPTHCHRRLLIGRVLREAGISALHIRGDGRVQTEEKIAKEEEFQKTKGQKTLFDVREKDEWISSQSVSPRKKQAVFSGFSNGRE